VGAVLGVVHHVRGAVARSVAVTPAHAPAYTRVMILPSSHRHEPAAPPASARVAPSRVVHRPPSPAAGGVDPGAVAPAPNEAPSESEGALAAPPGPAGEPVDATPPSPATGAGSSVASTPTPGRGSTTVDVGALLHERLVAAAARCYPAAARRFHQTGEVTVVFCLDAAGGLARAEVRHSSGVPALDAATLECVVPDAAPFPLAAAGQCFDVPVRFGLK
jgi:TonB family protein